MSHIPNVSTVPVILLYNIEPSWSKQDQDEVTALSQGLKDALHTVEVSSTLAPVFNDDFAHTLALFSPKTHIVFNWCESVPGVKHSEMLVARKLEDLGYVFTGANSTALTLSQDKYKVKKLLEACSIPTPKWMLCESPDSGNWNTFPAIVKPVHEHSSEGITGDSVVLSRTALAERVKYVLSTYQQPALIEEFIDGREFHIALWGNTTVEMLPAVEMDFKNLSNVKDRLCTYDAKFLPGSPLYEGIITLLPAPLTSHELLDLENVCKSAYRAVGCRDYGRIDLRLRDGIFYVLDVNPNADISSDASFACAAEELGMSYGQFGAKILNFALERVPLRGI